MSRRMKGLLMALMLLAAAVSGRLGVAYLEDRAELRRLTALLAESRETWEGIAAEKEALQEEKKQAEEELREAKLTLEESTGRAAELAADIENLRADIRKLQGED